MDRAQLPLGREPLQRKSSLLTTKSPEVPGTHLIDLGRMKGWVNFYQKYTPNSANKIGHLKQTSNSPKKIFLDDEPLNCGTSLKTYSYPA